MSGPAIIVKNPSALRTVLTGSGRPLNASTTALANPINIVPNSTKASPIGIMLAFIPSMALLNLVEADSVSSFNSVAAVCAN